MINTQFHARIKVFISNCTEYISFAMRQILSSHGTLFQRSWPHAHKQNGIVKLNNVIFLTLFVTPLLVPSPFLVKAALTVVHMINITPSTILSGATPNNCVHSGPLRYDFLRVFGCHWYVFLHPHKRNKVVPHIVTCINLMPDLRIVIIGVTI